MPWCSANFTYIRVKTTAQTPMLLAQPVINTEVQGLKIAVDMFSIVTNFFTDSAKGTIMCNMPWPICGRAKDKIIWDTKKDTTIIQ